jgi:1,4-alpha-glucan branching enzyme
MNSLHRSKIGTAHNLRSVVFICDAPAAAAVTLIGDFNKWNTHSHPLQKQPDGGWLLRMEMKHGHHRYAYLVDGALTLDPRAMGVTRNDEGQRVALIAVS